jgi:hypothetical protein
MKSKNLSLVSGTRINCRNSKRDQITTVERTIADVIMSGLAEEHIRQAIHEALQRGLTSPTDLLRQAQRAGGKAKRIIENILAEKYDGK